MDKMCYGVLQVQMLITCLPVSMKKQTPESSSMRLMPSKGSRNIVIRTVDPDVVVMAVANFERLGIDCLWIGFGTGKAFHYIAVHDIAVGIGSHKAETLPGFHAFTGCDIVSSFSGRGKKSEWDVWKVFPEVTAAFKEISVCCSGISASTVDLL